MTGKNIFTPSVLFLLACFLYRWRFLGEIHERVLCSVVVPVDQGLLVCGLTSGVVWEIHVDVNQTFLILWKRREMIVWLFFYVSIMNNVLMRVYLINLRWCKSKHLDCNKKREKIDWFSLFLKVSFINNEHVF